MLIDDACWLMLLMLLLMINDFNNVNVNVDANNVDANNVDRC